MVAADAEHARDLGGFEPAPEMQVQDRVLPFVERGRGFPDEVGGGGAFREGERVGRCARVFDGGEIEPSSPRALPATSRREVRMRVTAER